MLIVYFFADLHHYVPFLEMKTNRAENFSDIFRHFTREKGQIILFGKLFFFVKKKMTVFSAAINFHFRKVLLFFHLEELEPSEQREFE